MRIKIVTSFNLKLWEEYARDCISTWLDHLKFDDEGSIIEVWIDGPFPRDLISSPRIKYKSLNNQSPALKEFIRNWGSHPVPQLPEGSPGYKFNFIPFSFKVFSLAQAAWAIKNKEQTGFDLFCWLDADVKLADTVDSSWLLNVIGDNDIAWLDRGGRWGCGETGFILCKTNNALDLFLEVANCYSSGQLFFFAEWHDAFVYTAHIKLKEFTDEKEFKVRNLNEDFDGKVQHGLYPFETSMLKEKMLHLKGNLKGKTSDASAA